jgi:transcriptional regulator with XRE-family HTH domain
MSRKMLVLDYDAFSNYVRTYRKSKHKTQEQVAEEAGVDINQMVRLEKPGKSWRRADTVVAIAAWMDCDVRIFLKQKEETRDGGS